MGTKKRKYGSSIVSKGSRRVLPAEKQGLEKNTAAAGQSSKEVVLTAAKLTPEQKEARKSNRANKSSGAKGGFNIKTKKLKAKTPKMETPDLVSKGKEGRKKEVSGSQRRANKKKKRLLDKRNSLRSKADKYAVGDKKRDRLLKRAKRKDERAAGTRKSAVGTALQSAGRSTIQALAYAGGGPKIKWGGKSSEKKKKTSESQKKASEGFKKIASKKINTSIKKPKKLKF